MSLIVLTAASIGLSAVSAIPSHWRTNVVLPVTTVYAFDVQTIDVREPWTEILDWLIEEPCHEIQVQSEDGRLNKIKAQKDWLCVYSDYLISIEVSEDMTLWHETRLKHKGAVQEPFSYSWPKGTIRVSYRTMSLWRYAREVERSLDKVHTRVVLRQTSSQSYVIAWYENETFVVRTAQRQNGSLLTFEYQIHQMDIGG